MIFSAITLFEEPRHLLRKEMYQLSLKELWVNFHVQPRWCEGFANGTQPTVVISITQRQSGQMRVENTTAQRNDKFPQIHSSLMHHQTEVQCSVEALCGIFVLSTNECWHQLQKKDIYNVRSWTSFSISICFHVCAHPRFLFRFN